MCTIINLVCSYCHLTSFGVAPVLATKPEPLANTCPLILTTPLWPEAPFLGCSPGAGIWIMFLPYQGWTKHAILYLSALGQENGFRLSVFPWNPIWMLLDMLLAIRAAVGYGEQWVMTWALRSWSCLYFDKFLGLTLISSGSLVPLGECVWFFPPGVDRLCSNYSFFPHLY